MGCVRLRCPLGREHRVELNQHEPGPADDLSVWRQRLANKFAEGAHHDVMIYCAGEIEKLGVPCSIREFHCPHCQQSGSIVTQGRSGEQATTFGLHDHEYIGDGKFYCTNGYRKRIFQEPSLFQTDRPEAVTEPESASPWIAYHDQLIKEWFDGERVLIDDLYPGAPKRGTGIAAKTRVMSALFAVLPTAVFVGLIWVALWLFA